MGSHQERNYVRLVADEQEGSAVVVPQSLQFFCDRSSSRGIKARERLVEDDLPKSEIENLKQLQAEKQNKDM